MCVEGDKSNKMLAFIVLVIIIVIVIYWLCMKSSEESSKEVPVYNGKLPTLTLPTPTLPSFNIGSGIIPDPEATPPKSAMFHLKSDTNESYSLGLDSVGLSVNTNSTSRCPKTLYYADGGLDEVPEYKGYAMLTSIQSLKSGLFFGGSKLSHCLTDRNQNDVGASGKCSNTNEGEMWREVYLGRGDGYDKIQLHSRKYPGKCLSIKKNAILDTCGASGTTIRKYACVGDNCNPDACG
jgi:hypothetical protein